MEGDGLGTWPGAAAVAVGWEVGGTGVSVWVGEGVSEGAERVSVGVGVASGVEVLGGK